MNRRIIRNIALAVLPLMLLLPLNRVAAAESGMSFSIRSMGGNWTGKNKTSGTDFEADKGGQTGLAAVYQNGDFYTGLNLQGGQYTFNGQAPDQVSQSGTTAISDDKITHSELDLVFGYYLTRYFSLFMDIKGASDTWQSNQHKQDFSGVGLGVTGFWPINDNWTLYGSLGAVSSGNLKIKGEKIGTGKSSALDIGVQYSFSGSGHRVLFGLKSSTYVYTFDAGDEQTHTISGAYLGYSYAFSLD